MGMAIGPAALAASAGVAAPRQATMIDSLEVFRLPVNKRGDWIIVRLKASNGLTGIGDASQSGHDVETIAWLKRLLDLLRGRSVFDIAWFREASAALIAQSPDAKAIVAARRSAYRPISCSAASCATRCASMPTSTDRRIRARPRASRKWPNALSLRVHRSQARSVRRNPDGADRARRAVASHRSRRRLCRGGARGDRAAARSAHRCA